MASSPANVRYAGRQPHRQLGTPSQQILPSPPTYSTPFHLTRGKIPVAGLRGVKVEPSEKMLRVLTE
jgi:hypothetical protein